jgi:hypothetical protein
MENFYIGRVYVGNLLYGEIVNFTILFLNVY